MEGVIALIIISWILRSLKKKPGKTKKAFAGKAVSAITTKQRTEKHEPKAEPAQTLQPLNTPMTATIGEGDSFGALGSMAYDSSEGECICEPELEHNRETLLAEETVYQNEIGSEPLIDFSSKGILQGIVMNEILTRPSERRVYSSAIQGRNIK